MMRFLAWAQILLVLTPLYAQTSYVPATRTLYEKGQQLSLGADVFQTSEVINSDGTRRALEGDESFTRYQIEGLLRYGLTDKLQVGGGARFRHNDASFPVDGERETASSSGLQSLLAVITFGFKPVGNYRFAFEGLYRHTPYTNEESQESDGNIILGDDGNEYSGGLAVTYQFQNMNALTVRGGYRKPGIDLSDEIYWQAEGALVWNSFALVAGVDGVSTLENDPYSEDDRPAYHTGPTALYNGFNRQWIAPYVGMNIALGKLWRVEFRAAQVVDGQSTDIGRSYGLQVVRRVESRDPRKSTDARFKTYDIEANVNKISPKKEYVQIDKGLTSDVQKGMSFDLFEFDYVGGNRLVARGTVVSVKSETAILKVTQRFDRKREIKEGLLARGNLK